MGQYDILVRHVAHRQPQALAQGLLPEVQVQAARWIDTQLTAIRERRADKALELQAAHGHGLLKVEFSIDPGRVIFFRMFEYSSLMIIGHHAATSGEPSGPAAYRAAVAPSDPTEPDVEEVAAGAPISAILFILRGRKKPWPAEGRYRISPPGAPFSGLRFRIEAVYQRTVDELWARPGSFWLVFTCLAVDANVEKMRLVIDEIDRREPCEPDREELYLALLTLAELDPWGYGLHKEIGTMLQKRDLEATFKRKWMRELYMMVREEVCDEMRDQLRNEVRDQLRDELRNEVRDEVRDQVSSEVRDQIIEEMLHHQLVRHLQRELTPAEREALLTRAGTLTSAEAADLVSHATPTFLLRWLFGADEQ